MERGGTWRYSHDVLSAFKQAWASWKSAPGVALLAVIAFAVGIGAATAIFTVINGVLLRQLPYPDGERFVSLYGVNTTNPGTMMTLSVPELQDYQQQTTSFDAFGGGQMALGRAGFVHVAWNASRPIERDGVRETPMWYARLRPGARAFEPQRPIGSHTRHLDGGGSVAADAEGRVHVVWHAAGSADGETNRRIYVATSSDDGARFSKEAPFGDAAGLCGCCQLETLIDRHGQLNVLYRAAGETGHRDAMWLRLVRGRTTAPVRLQAWQLQACPMTTFAMTHRGGDIVAAWETQQQIHAALLTPESLRVSETSAMSGTAVRKHPSVAVNTAGDTLYAWTEGTAWARGGTVAWELRNDAGARVASASSAGEVPVWSPVAAAARADGSFLLIH